MNSDQMQHIVELIAARLLARVNNAVTLSQEELRHGSAMAHFLTHDTLYVQQTEMGFLHQLAEGDRDNTAVAHLFEAFNLGICVTVTLNSRLLRCLPLRALAKLPLSLCDEQRNGVHVCSGNLVSYRDVVGLSGGWLVTSRKTIITALARETLAARHIRLLKQE